MRPRKGKKELKSLAARALVATSWIFFAAGPVGAATQQSQAASPDILVLVNPLEQNTEEFRALIGDAARYKLGKLGLTAQVVAASPSEAENPQMRTKASGAAVGLVCRYLVEGQQMTVTLSWYDMSTGSAPAIVQTTGQMDLNLDDVILAALDEIFTRMQQEIALLSARRSSQRMAEAKPASAQSVAPILVPPTSTTQVIVPTATPAPNRHHLLLSGGFAPFLPTGAAGYYFTVGYLPSLLASYSFDMTGGHVGVGVYAGVDYFNANGLQDSSTNFLLPVGVDLRYELGSATVRPFFHVVSGPAFLVMLTGTQGTLVDILAFLKSGVGLEVQVVPWMGFSALVDYDVYFEMPYLITGFSPSLGMVFRP